MGTINQQSKRNPCLQKLGWLSSPTFYLGFSTILLGYVTPALTTPGTISNICEFFPAIWNNLHNGNLFLTVTTILTTLIYDPWHKAQLNFKGKKNPRIGSSLNFFLIMTLITVSILFALVQPLKGEISDFWVYVEIIFFIFALMFHARVNWITNNSNQYQKHFDTDTAKKNLSKQQNQQQKTTLTDKTENFGNKNA